jgi:hypothetical protein
MAVQSSFIYSSFLLNPGFAVAYGFVLTDVSYIDTVYTRYVQKK